jgi:hypothetical protein
MREAPTSPPPGLPPAGEHPARPAATAGTGTLAAHPDRPAELHPAAAKGRPAPAFPPAAPPTAADIATTPQPADRSPAPAGAPSLTAPVALPAPGGTAPRNLAAGTAPADALARPSGEGWLAGPAGGVEPAHRGTAPPAPEPARAAPPAAAPPVPRQIAEAAVRAIPGEVSVQLNPAELGEVRMTLQTDGDVLRVTLEAQRAETLDLLRRHVADLAGELRAAGYDATRFEFGRQGRGTGGHTAGGDPGAARGPETAAAGGVATLARPLTAGRDLDLRV